MWLGEVRGVLGVCDREPGRFEAGDEVTFTVRMENVFASGRIYATPAVARGSVIMGTPPS